MPDNDVPGSAEEAWNIMCGVLQPKDESDARLYRAIFISGMASALSIAYHHGFVTLRADVDRMQRETIDA